MFTKPTVIFDNLYIKTKGGTFYKYPHASAVGELVNQSYIVRRWNHRTLVWLDDQFAFERDFITAEEINSVYELINRNI